MGSETTRVVRCPTCHHVRRITSGAETAWRESTGAVDCPSASAEQA